MQLGEFRIFSETDKNIIRDVFDLRVCSDLFVLLPCQIFKSRVGGSAHLSGGLHLYCVQNPTRDGEEGGKQNGGQHDCENGDQIPCSAACQTAP